MGKEWDKLAPNKEHGHTRFERSGNNAPRFGPWTPTANADGVAKVRTQRVQMQEWHERWAREAFRVLKPGAHLVAFSGTRTYHRMVCAIEDAGFEIRDSLHWIYGSGFPKSLDVSKQIDKMAGAEREVVGKSARHVSGKPGQRTEGLNGSSTFAETVGMGQYITAPATEAAKEWQGFGTALKPSHEPVVCARKPLTPVPELDKMAAEFTLLMEALLWWVAPTALTEKLSSHDAVKLAESISESNPQEQGAAFASVRWIASVLHTLRSGEASETTDTFNSPEAASTFWNIVGLWQSISDALSIGENMSTTETGTRLTTALRTLNSLLLATIPESITEASYRQNGLWSTVETVAESSSADVLKWTHIPKPSADEHVSSPIARGVIGTLADIVASLSSHHPLTDANSAHRPAQTDTTTTSDGKPSPAHEPIVLARKPLAEKNVASNVLKWNCGALNIDGTRVQSGEDTSRIRALVKSTSAPFGEGYEMGGNGHAAGRWPPNLLLSHSEGCVRTGEVRRVPSHNPGNKTLTGEDTTPNAYGKYNKRSSVGHADPDGTEAVEAYECVEDCPVRLMDEQSGTLRTGAPGTVKPGSDNYSGGWTGHEVKPYSDTGGASRFFPNFENQPPFVSAPIPWRYQSKASRRERNAGLEGMPEQEKGVYQDDAYQWRVVDTRPGRVPHDAPRAQAANHHPTVKPIDLMRWLVRLVTPPGGVVLDPFAGSGSTGCAAVQEGMHFIGIEMDPEYAEIARRRIAYWSLPEYERPNAATSGPIGRKTYSRMAHNALPSCPEHGEQKASFDTRYPCGCHMAFREDLTPEPPMTLF
jgi:DNA modification methylase